MCVSLITAVLVHLPAVIMCDICTGIYVIMSDIYTRITVIMIDSCTRIAVELQLTVIVVMSEYSKSEGLDM